MKKLLNELKKRFLGSMQNNMSLALTSLILAVVVWFSIAMTQSPSESTMIEGIKLSIDTVGSPIDENELSVVDCDVQTVKVKIKASRTQIRNITPDTLRAYIDFSSISSSGEKTLPIKVEGISSDVKFELEGVYPSNAKVNIDKYSTIELPVSAKLPNITYAEGKTPDEYVCEPSFISITGPSTQLGMISECYAYSDKAMENKDSSFTVNTNSVVFYTSDGVEVDQSKLTLSNTVFTVTVPVLTQKTVTPHVEIMKAPTSFNKEWLKKRLKLSSESLTIASNNILGEISDELEIGKIALNDIDLGYSASFDIEAVLENAGLINKSGIDSVTVSLDDTGLARKEITLDSKSIRLSNIPNDGYDYSVLTQKLTISVVGQEDIINDLTSEDFVADASLLNVDTSQQKLNIDVIVSCLTHDNVWSVTKVKVPVHKTEKSYEDVTTETNHSN